MSGGNIVYDNSAFMPGAAAEYSDNSGETKDFPLKKKTTELQESQGDYEKDEPSSFKKLVSHYAATTTAHGVGRIADAKSSLVRRLIWSLVSVGLYATVFWMCIALVVFYMKKPVVSRTEMSFEESLDFPAVTICNLNMIRREKLETLQKTILLRVIEGLEQRSGRRPTSLEQRVNITSINATEDVIRQKIQAIAKFKKEYLLSKAMNADEKEILSNAEVDIKSLENNFLDKVLKSIPEDELSKVGHDLDEMLKYCRWSSFNCKTGSLRTLWRHFWHWKYGNCYIFNSGLTENGTKLPVMNTDRAGPNNGLELDIFINQQSYTRLTDEAGVRVVLTDQSRMPFPFDEGFSIPTGFATSIGIKMKFVKRVDPYLNNSCVDDGKAGVDTRTIYTEKYYVNYSTQACRMSCLASEEVERCNCSEARFPINSSACFSEEQNKCINDILRKFTKTGLDCIAKCPQPCLENAFSRSISSARWSTAFDAMIRRLYLKNHPKAKDIALRDNFLRLQIFYEDLSVFKTINEEAYKIENLLADIGGQLGLWIGCSVMTFVELLEFMANLLGYLWEKWHK